MSNIVRKNLGAVTAYKYAVSQGFEGTEQEFAALMASYATVAIEAESAKDDAIDAKTAAERAQEAAEAAAEQAESAIVVDDSLSIKGRAADAKETGKKIAGLKDNLAIVTGNSEITYIPGGYIALNGALADINTIVPNASWRRAVVSCTEGDAFTVNGVGGSSPRVWGFLASDGTVLSVSAANITETNRTIIAPENTAYLVLNDNSGAVSFYGVLVKDAVREISDSIDKIEIPSVNLFDVAWDNARYNNGVYKPLETGVSYAAAVPVIPVNPETVYTLSWSDISITSGTYTLYVDYLDSSRAFLDRFSKTYRTYGAQATEFTTPEDTAFVAVFLYSQDAQWTTIIPNGIMLVRGSTLPIIYTSPTILNPDMYDPARIVSLVSDSKLVDDAIYTAQTRNIFKGVWEAARYTNGVFVPYLSGNAAVRPITQVQVNTTYTISWGNNVDNLGTFYVIQFDAEGNQIAYDTVAVKAHSIKITTENTAAYLGFQIYYSTGTLDTLAPDFMQVEQGYKTEHVNPKALSNQAIDFVSLLDTHNNVLIPDYYYANNYLCEKAERVKYLMERLVASGDAFIFITDEHWEINQRHSPSLINYFSKHTNINTLVSGGDTANTVSESFCNDLRRAFDKNIYHIVGNHDWFAPATSSLIYYNMHMFNNGIYGNGENHYYYYDNTLQKIRYIVLNAFTSESGDDHSMHYVSGYTQEQITWFQNVLAESNGYNVIVLTHYLGTTDVTSIQGAGDIRSAIDSYNNLSSDGKVIAVLQGHTHYDGVFSTDAGVPIITTTSDKNMPYVTGGVDLEPWLNNRISGTVDEQAFDVDIVDSKNRIIYAIRVGAPAMNNYKRDSEPGFVTAMTAEERIIHCDAVRISDDTTLSPEIIADTWGTDNDDICTVTDGVVHPVSTGKTYIFATNAIGQLEIWIVIAS